MPPRWIASLQTIKVADNHSNDAASAAQGSQHGYTRGGHHIAIRKAQELGLDLSDLERAEDGSWHPKRQSDQPTDLTGITNADPNASGSAKPEKTQEISPDRAYVVEVTHQVNGTYLSRAGKAERCHATEDACHTLPQGSPREKAYGPPSRGKRKISFLCR